MNLFASDAALIRVNTVKVFSLRWNRSHHAIAMINRIYANGQQVDQNQLNVSKIVDIELTNRQKKSMNYLSIDEIMNS